MLSLAFTGLNPSGFFELQLCFDEILDLRSLTALAFIEQTPKSSESGVFGDLLFHLSCLFPSCIVERVLRPFLL